MARGYRLSRRTGQYRLRRAAGQRLDRAAWRDRPARPRPTPRHPELEALVLTVRRELREPSDRGTIGAAAIRRELPAQGAAATPATNHGCEQGRLPCRSGRQQTAVAFLARVMV